MRRKEHDEYAKNREVAEIDFGLVTEDLGPRDWKVFDRLVEMIADAPNRLWAVGIAATVLRAAEERGAARERRNARRRASRGRKTL